MKYLKYLLLFVWVICFGVIILDIIKADNIRMTMFEKTKTDSPTKRIQVILHEETDSTVCEVIKDTVTGKSYLFYQIYQSAAMVEIK